METTRQGSSNRVNRQAEWTSKLTLWSNAALLFLAVTGLSIWLLPFSRFNQLSVLAHTLIGLVFLSPIVIYTVRHWRMYWGHVLTQTKLLGYVSLAVLLVCVVSGLVLTYQPLFGVKIGYLWRSLHAWTTVGLLALGLPHILIPLLRVARARLTDAGSPIWAGAKLYGRGVLVLTVLFAGLVGLVSLAYGPPRLLKDFPAGYDLWEQKNPLYGKNRPFAPSLARTVDSRPIDSRLLSGSEGCGTSGCHEQIVREWQPSAHRYAAMDRAFQAIQLTMAKQNGPTSTRYCGGCHDPISLFSGTKNIDADEKKLTALEGFREGISCLACHSVRETDIKGNAFYSVKTPSRYFGELEYDRTKGKAWRLVRDFLIRAYPREHVATLSKVMFKKPEYCAACHKQFVDEEINKVGWVQLQNQYDNWRMSKWARDLKQPAAVIECRECHMPLTDSTDPAAGDDRDYNRSINDRKHRSHRFLGGNQLMPGLLHLEGADQHSQLTQLWLKGKINIPEIEGKWHSTDTPAVSIQLVTPSKVRPGEKITLKCIITSNKVGHDFPTGPLDIIQSWIEIVAKDEDGKVVFDSGTVDDKGFIKPGSFLFKAEPVDQYGNLIDRHNLWEMVGVRNRRSLFPGFSDTAEFGFVCPDSFQPKRRSPPPDKEFAFKAPSPGKLHILAKLRYRKIDQFLINFIRSAGFFSEYQGKQLTSPITDMHECQALIEVSS
jgi:hypothetical protein